MTLILIYIQNNAACMYYLLKSYIQDVMPLSSFITLQNAYLPPPR
jgi:ABC-type maltose transport system permease subunit